MDDLDKIKKLKLHQTHYLKTMWADVYHTCVMRVPGGLIYIFKLIEHDPDNTDESKAEKEIELSTQFVPFDDFTDPL